LDFKVVMNTWTRILPKSVLGKWSVALAVIGILLDVVFMVLVATGNLDTESPAPWISAVTGIPVMAAFVTGVIAIVLSKERAILVYLGMALLVLLFVLGEFLFPH
jgi:hypothetical protein